MNAPYTPDAVSRLLTAVLHPETIEGYDPLEARAAEIEEALNDPFIDKATAFELLDELGEITTKQGKE
jgi:hypothetical protein